MSILGGGKKKYHVEDTGITCRDLEEYITVGGVKYLNLFIFCTSI